MYKIYYGDDIVYDPFSPDEHAYNVTCYGGLNDKGDMNLTIPYSHPLYSKFRIRDLDMRLVHDEDTIFTGYITQIEKDFDLNLNIKCSGILGYLGDVVLPPYTTNQAELEEEMLLAITGPAGLFDWYIEQYNAQATHPFLVGVNDTVYLGRTGSVNRSNNSYSTVGDEIETQLLDTVGGYLYARRENGSNYIDYYGDVTETNPQIIDFGVNLVDYLHTEDSANLYTSLLVPDHIYTKNDGTEVEVSIKSIPDDAKLDGYTIIDGNVLVNTDSYEKYGFRETVYSDTDAATNLELYQSACAYLKTVSSPDTMLTVKAVDLSLYMDGYKHLKPGEICRVRSKAHGMDQYLVVTQMEIDLDDPGNTEFTLGIVYDTLTGEESSKLRELNSNLDTTVDEVGALGDDVLANAKEIEELAQRLESTEFERSEFEEQVRDSIKDLQKIADGAIETWFYPYSPAPDKEPTSNWKTDEEKYRHIGDLFYNTETGKAFRYMYEPNSQGDMVYSWGPIVDTDVEAALREASIAKDTADSKRRVFFETPYPPYDEGDLWAQGANGNILVSTVDQRTKFNASDWVYAAKYAKAIYSTEEQFYQSDSPDVLKGGSWSTNNDWIEGKYTWRRTLVTYGDGDTEWVPSETGVCIAGNDGKDGKDGTNGKDGANGKDGNGITKIVQYYLATNLSSGVTTSTPGWSETIQTMTEAKPYLWNYSITYYTLESSVNSTPVIIGHYGENGDDGVGIESITEYYLVSPANTGVTHGTAGWSTAVPTMTSTLKYLWNYKATKYTNGITKNTEPVIIGAYGDKGEDGKDGKDGANGKDGLNGEMLSGSSSSAESATAKTCTGVSGFSLYDGVCVTIYFKYGNTADKPTLNVNSTGAFPIMTNGVNLAYWTAGQAVVFVYYATEKAWYVASHPVWATEETIGNPTSKNVYINANGINLRTGKTVNSLFTADTISLGDSSMSSVIKFCNNSARMTTSYEIPDGLTSAFQEKRVTLTSGTTSETRSAIRFETESSTSYGRSYINMSSPTSYNQGEIAIVGGNRVSIYTGSTGTATESYSSVVASSTGIEMTAKKSNTGFSYDGPISMYCGDLKLNASALYFYGRPRGTSFSAISASPSSDVSLFRADSDNDHNYYSMRIPLDKANVTYDSNVTLAYTGGIYIEESGRYEISAVLGITSSTMPTSCGLYVNVNFRSDSSLPYDWSGVNNISIARVYPIPGGTYSVALPPKIIGIDAGRYVYLTAKYSGAATGVVAVGGGTRTYLTVRRVG